MLAKKGAPTDRARTKYTKLYRREAAVKVSRAGGRGKARPTNARNRQRAEVFEDALARVSTRLADEARATAAALREERIEAARAGASGPGKPSAKGTGKKSEVRSAPNARKGDRDLVSPRSRAKGGAVRAKGARRQAKRDSR